MTDGPVPEIDPSKPHSARIYDYGLGGKNHFAADRAVAEQVLANMPTALTVARENRKFLGRAVRYLVAEAGVRQFLDIGAGLPTTENVHEVAQRADPPAPDMPDAEADALDHGGPTRDGGSLATP